MKTTVLVLCFAIASLVGPLAIAQNCGGIDWVAPTGAVPTARTGAAMAYDSFRGRLVLFGGQLVGGGVSSATWEFDGAQWQQVSPTGSPAARYGHAMVYDSARHVVVMFGGMLNGGTLSSGTYEYNGTAWTQRTVPGTPTARQGHAMAYDSVRGRVVLFGGLSATSLLSDTREYDGQVWQLVSASGPTARQGHAMAFDVSRHVTVLFGGRTSAVQPTDSDETWEWNGAAWSHLLITGPAARSGHCMAFDTSRGVAVLFGGIQGSTYLNSTWEYSAAGWLAAAPATDPSAKAGACAAFDAGRGRVVMCGGANGGVISAEAWELVASGAAPEFSLQPSPISAAPGEVVSFHSLADGAAGWRWVKDGQPLSNGGRISGALGPTLTISGVTMLDWGVYHAEASNDCGTTPSNPAALTQSSACGTADFNCDGDIGTDSDIDSFFRCLAGTCPAPPCSSSADFNGDGDTGTDADIESFFRVLAGGSC